MGSALDAALAIALATLRRKRTSLLVFALGAFLFQYILVASYPAIGGAAAVNSVVHTFPPALRRLLKIAPNLQAGFGLRDYLALGFFHPVFLGLGAAFVVGRAADALAGEIERGSIYLLLSRPVRRWSVVAGKMLELVVGAGSVALAAWAGLIVGIGTTTLPQAVSPLPYLLVALDAWALFAALGGGALIIASLGRRTGQAGGLGTIWTLVAFVLDVLPATGEGPVAVLNPWHHYDPPAIVASGSVPVVGALVLVGWVVGGTLAAIAIWGRRDLG